MILDIEYQLKGQSPYLHTEKTNDDMRVIIEDVGFRHTVKLIAKKDIVLTRGKLSGVHKFQNSDVFPTNGYQSWTDTRERTFKERNKERDPNRIPKVLRNIYGFERYGDGVFYPYKPHSVHGYDIFYVKGEKEIFSFNFNYKTAYIIYEIHLKRKELDILSDVYGLHMKEGDEVVLYDLYFNTSFKEGLKDFQEAFTLKDTKKIFGYTSWYNYYQNINEEIILKDLDALDSRFNLFQIDDGYETFVGDWLDVDPIKFPNGLKPIVDKIHQKGYKAGIWLAPFVGETKSKLFKEHTDWFKHDEDGSISSCGGNWSGFYALDLDKKEVRAYVRKCLQYFVDLGFDFFKLDFLYASMIAPTPGKTRAMMSDQSYQLVRDILKDKLILGCGANCFSSYQKFDYLRIGPDVSLKFDDIWYMKYMHRERISTKVTLQNTIYRSYFNNHLFLNDPDVFLLRKDNIQMSDKQKESLLTINALFGSVLMTSDNIASYDEQTKALLEEKLKLFYSAEDVKFLKDRKNIKVSYVLEGKPYTFTYNTKKGTMRYE
ncbi:MAG: alpha-galactosidase [Bacilli bacterium]|nr:alpha-galactosidase [Bacilli bacterium]